jgi:hypothetical protein
MAYQIDWVSLREIEAIRKAKQAICIHEFVALDPGPYSDDILYIVCKKCDFQKL